MYVPKPEQIDKVIETLEIVAGRSEEFHLEMGEIGIVKKGPQDEACKTVACHGGVYVLGMFFQDRLESTLLPRPGFDSENRIFSMLKAGSDDFRFDISYTTGVDQIAADLGFDSKLQLCTWAKAMPELWGGPHGDYMFVGVRAFWSLEELVDMDDPNTSGTIYSRTDLSRIIFWWKGVRDRVADFWASNPPPHYV